MAQGVSRLSVENFLSHSAEKKQRNPSTLCFRKTPVAKNLWIRGGGSIMFFSRQFFFAHFRKNQQGNPSVLCFRKFLAAKIFMDKNEGISRVSVENFLSDSAEKFRSGTLQCVINFGYRNILCFRGLCNDFLSKNFCLTVPKHFVGEPFCAMFQRNCSSEKVYG